MKRGAMLDLVFSKKEGLVGNVNLKGRLGCSGHEMVEFKSSKETGQQDQYLKPQ